MVELIIVVSGECRLWDIDDSSVECRCLVLLLICVVFRLVINCVCSVVWVMLFIIVVVSWCCLGVSCVVVCGKCMLVMLIVWFLLFSSGRNYYFVLVRVLVKWLLGCLWWKV